MVFIAELGECSNIHPLNQPPTGQLLFFFPLPVLCFSQSMYVQYSRAELVQSHPPCISKESLLIYLCVSWVCFICGMQWDSWCLTASFFRLYVYWSPKQTQFYTDLFITQSASLNISSIIKYNL